jgi:hypothetical protein
MKPTCANCKSNKVKNTPNHPLNYHCKKCGMMFYDSKIEDDSKKLYVSEFIYSIIALLIISGIFYLLLFIINLIKKL